MTEPGAIWFRTVQTRLMVSEQVSVVAPCFEEVVVISTFIERVVALPEVNCLLQIDNGSSDAKVSVISAWHQSHPN